MRKNVIPTYHATSLFEVNIDFFVKKGIKYLFVDLDNTLDSYKQPTPSTRVYDLVRDLKAKGITLIIASNNSGSRVEKYASALKIDYYGNLGKPFSFKLEKLMKKHGISKNEAMMVGDQIMTDIKCGNACKIKTLFVEPLVKEDQWQTRFNRFWARPVLKKLHKQNLLKSWEVDYHG